MTSPYLIALDLDGTLLTDKKTITARTKETIAKVRNQGHIFMISTGRPFRSSVQFYNELQLDSPIVNFNGAFVHHPLNREWGIYHQPMSLDVAKDIVNASHNFKLFNIIAEVIDDVYLHYHDEKLLEIFCKDKPRITTGDLRTFLREDPTSLLIHADVKDVPSIRKHLSDVHAEVIDHRRWGAPFHIIEIVKAGLNKALGIQRVADYYQIPRENIIAFGDEDNDLEMLEYAGIGVAMDNAIEALKNISNEVTLSNEEDGIAVFLENYFNL